jgi:putative ABC transport system permease protein
MADNKRFGVLWMGREGLASAFDLESAFDDLALSTLRGADSRLIIGQIDRVLAPYGGVGAIERADQLSNWFVVNELDQLGKMSTILPTIFLAVAAFLANMVVTRLIAIERSEIGLMKAFGYGGGAIGWHYAKLVIAIAALGIVLGCLVGAWLGRLNTEMYAELFRFPILIYRPGPKAFAIGALVSLFATVTGTLSAVRRAATQPPAEAMRPSSPPTFRHSPFFDRLTGWLDQPTRILLRQITRFPLRSALTAFAVATSVGLLVMAMQWIDAIDYIAQSFFRDAQRQDVMVGLVQPRATTAVHEFERLPGVLAAEPMRIVAADFSNGIRNHRGSLTGITRDATLQPICDSQGATIPVPPRGMVLGTKLAEKLAVGVGDSVSVEIREGRRPTIQMPVQGVFETYIGMPAFIDLGELNRLLRERPSLEYVSLLVDKSEQPQLFAELKELPQIATVMLRQAALDSFYETIGEHLMVFVSFFVAFACALGLGVVYNSARIALSERGRELATLRVLGFTKLETSYILLGEVGLLILAGLPVGYGMGWVLTTLMSVAFETELFRVPAIVESSTYGMAVMIALLATFFSAAFVQRRVDHLNMIEVLKTRE